MTVQILRPAQIDGRASLNTSRIRGATGPSCGFPAGWRPPTSPHCCRA